MNLKIFGKVLTSKSVGTGPSSYEKRIYQAAVSQRLRNTALERNRTGPPHSPTLYPPISINQLFTAL